MGRIFQVKNDFILMDYRWVNSPLLEELCYFLENQDDFRVFVQQDGFVYVFWVKQLIVVEIPEDLAELALWHQN